MRVHAILCAHARHPAYACTIIFILVDENARSCVHVLARHCITLHAHQRHCMRMRGTVCALSCVYMHIMVDEHAQSCAHTRYCKRIRNAVCVRMHHIAHTLSRLHKQHRACAKYRVMDAHAHTGSRMLNNPCACSIVHTAQRL